MANIIIARPELGDLASLTAGSSSASFPVANLQRKQPTDVWQSTGLSDLYIVADLGSVQPLNLVALLFTNATSNARWQIRAADTEAELTAAPTYDSGEGDGYLLQENGDRIYLEDGVSFLRNDPANPVLWASNTNEARRHGLHWIPAGISARWVRIDVADLSNAAGVFRAGRLYISNAWQPAVNMSIGAAHGWEDSSKIGQTLGANDIPNSKPTRPFASFTLGFLSDVEADDNVYEIDRARGSSKDVLVVTDPEHATRLHNRIYYGLLSNGRRLSARQFDLYEVSYTLKGMI